MFDPDGNWQTDGHYRSVYLVGVMLGITNAERIAYYTEYPDTKIKGNKAEERYTWALPFVQQNTHSLNHGLGPWKSVLATRALMKQDLGDMEEFGRLLHKLGDTYAHRRLGDNKAGILYGNKIWTWDHAVADGSDPDMIYNRMTDGIYESYVLNMTAVLATKFGKSEAGKLDEVRNKLIELGKYAEKHKVSLIGIINYEVAVAKGENKFIVHNNQTLLPGGNAEYIKNTKDYLNRKGIKYTTKDIYETQKNFGVTKKVYLGTEFKLEK